MDQHTQIIDGKALAAKIKDQLKSDIEAKGLSPRLDLILVGDNPASLSYIKNKKKACEAVGITSKIHHFEANTAPEKLIDTIHSLNEDSSVNGILLQLPLPKGLDAHAIIEEIAPEKDVDGIHPHNMGALLRGDLNRGFIPCTPLGIFAMIESIHGADLSGLHVGVVGRSNIVGKPTNLILAQHGATITSLHSLSKDPAHLTSLCDIVVVAIGQAKLINQDWIKKGATVIDVGVNKVGEKDNGRAILVGDCDAKTLMGHAGALSLVPGGVGPMTIAMLLRNTVDACKRQSNL